MRDFDQAAASRRVFSVVRRQRDLAERLGVSASAVSALKRKGRVTLDLVLAASEITGRPVGWFLFGEKYTDPLEEARVQADIARESTEKCLDLAEQMRVGEGQANYGSSVQARLVLVEQMCRTHLAWLGVIERRLDRLEGKEGD